MVTERPPAILTLDSRGRLVANNLPGSELLEAGHLVVDRRGRVVGRDASSTQELGRLVALARRDGHGDGRLPGTSGSSLCVHASSLEPASAGAPAVVLVITPGRSVVDQEDVGIRERLRHRFGLTPTQAAIASLLARCQTPKEIAFSRGVSLETIRTHIRAIHAKTGVHRQTELLSLLSGSAADLPRIGYAQAVRPR